MATDPTTLSGGGKTHTSLISSASSILRRRTHWILCARRDHISIIKEKFEAQSLIRKRAQPACNQEIDVTFAQFPMQGFRLSGHDMKHDAWKAAGKPVDNRRHEGRGQNVVASDPHVASLGVGEEFNVLHALPQLVEDGDASLEQRSAIGRRLGAMAVAFKQAHAEHMFKVGDRL